MPNVKVLVLRTAGTNCDEETCHAFELAGAAADRVHVNRLVQQPDLLEQYQILALAGGFSYGDDIAAGKILANQLLHHFRQQVQEFVAADKLLIGICNGFQVLVKAGLLPALPDDDSPADPDTPSAAQATLTYNDSGKFEDRWVYLQPDTQHCAFIEPGRRIYLPIAHGEGKLCFANPALLKKVQAAGLVAFRYVDANGNTGPYPVNPNGSTDHIAGLCDPTGRILGLMPHPERHVHRTQHPRWTRGENGADGLAIFQHAVRYFA